MRDRRTGLASASDHVCGTCFHGACLAAGADVVKNAWLWWAVAETDVWFRPNLTASVIQNMLLIQAHQRPEMFVAFEVNWFDPFSRNNCADEFVW